MGDIKIGQGVLDAPLFHDSCWSLYDCNKKSRGVEVSVLFLPSYSRWGELDDEIEGGIFRFDIEFVQRAGPSLEEAEIRLSFRSAQEAGITIHRYPLPAIICGKSSERQIQNQFDIDPHIAIQGVALSGGKYSIAKSQIQEGFWVFHSQKYNLDASCSEVRFCWTANPQKPQVNPPLRFYTGLTIQNPGASFELTCTIEGKLMKKSRPREPITEVITVTREVNKVRWDLPVYVSWLAEATRRLNSGDDKAPEIPDPVEIRFGAYASVKDNETIQLIGDLDHLGSWEIPRAIPLIRPRNDGLPWTAKLKIPIALLDFQYKFFKVPGDGSGEIWEVIDGDVFSNHKYIHEDPPCRYVEVSVKWQ